MGANELDCVVTDLCRQIREGKDEISRLRAENEKLERLATQALKEASQLRAALIGVTSELGTFVGIFKGYQGMTMNNAQAALRAAAAALKEK